MAKKHLYVIIYINNIKELIAIKDVILFKIILSCIILNNNYEKRGQEYFEELMKNLELYNYQKEYIKILLEEKRKRNTNAYRKSFMMKEKGYLWINILIIYF